MANTFVGNLRYVFHPKMLKLYALTATALVVDNWYERYEVSRAVRFRDRSHLYYKENADTRVPSW
jgi:hypothetical protein